MDSLRNRHSKLGVSLYVRPFWPDDIVGGRRRDFSHCRTWRKTHAAASRFTRRLQGSVTAPCLYKRAIERVARMAHWGRLNQCTSTDWR
ncbi:unnamed protein product [Peniophora sp. CBMAI 1063]|nr:unnamed protein product [Peniophora sp. CBMAI 1063]